MTSTLPRSQRDRAVIRFAGDSGDGMQLTGARFTLEAGLAGNDLATFPDYPAEIRAPAGTTFGVSAYQIQFGAGEVSTPGDELDVLIAMNPAALQVNLADLRRGGLLVVDTAAFGERNLRRAGYAESPLDDGSLDGYHVLSLDITKLTNEAVKESGVSSREALRCRNMWALGLVLWMYGRERAATVDWLTKKFAAQPAVLQANLAALNAGHAFGETVEVDEPVPAFAIGRAPQEPGVYRTVSGTETLAWGLLAGVRRAGLARTVFASYPITPASPLLHVLAGFKAHGVVTFQAEDEIAAICAALGASYAGALGVTSSSGPGIALKTEALGLAVAVELPLIVINTQRAGPSTGMPTKVEQSDLFQAVHGRNGDAPLVVLAAATPADGFEVAMEAVRLATRFMTPVVVLSDGFVANASEPWRLPALDALPAFPVRFRTEPEGFHPLVRDPDTLARAWAIPGTPGLAHRVGGLERAYDTGHISYDPDNHQRMTDVRAAKIARIAADVPPQSIALGDDAGALAVVGWGSTFGTIQEAVRLLRADGHRVSHLHIRHLSPFPANLGERLQHFERILVPELNTGQLLPLLRAQYLVAAEGLNKVAGRPFRVSEIVDAARARVAP